jgi:hypothetical protein
MPAGYRITGLLQSAPAIDAGAILRYPARMRDPVQPALLSSGNPRIPKGDGDAPVQAYIAAMPGWKQEIGRRLDRMVAEACPQARRAVRWNTPLYGHDSGWFFAFYCYTRYVQLTFLQGSALTPLPPKASRVAGTRYLDIHEGTAWDADQVQDWIAQASRLPGVAL